MGRIDAHDEGAVTELRKLQPGSGRQTRFPYAALAAEEQDAHSSILSARATEAEARDPRDPPKLEFLLFRRRLEVRWLNRYFVPDLIADVLRIVFDLTGHGMTRPLAESIMALDFPEGDAARIDELNAKANEGTLTDDEEAELEAYINISDLLAYWQSKARRALQQPA